MNPPSSCKCLQYCFMGGLRLGRRTLRHGGRNAIVSIKGRHLLQDHVGESRIAPDRTGIIKRAPLKLMWTVGNVFRSWINPEQSRNVFVTVQSVRNEKR